MLVKIPDWLVHTKEINGVNCSGIYKEKLSKKLGIEKISLYQLKIEVRELGIKSIEEYYQKRKPNWPSTPHKYYKEKWIGWRNLLGNKKIEYVSFKKLRAEVRKLGIKSQKEYQLKRKPNWPSRPHDYYKNEWISWRDFLGTKKICFGKIKLEIKKLGIKSSKEYRSKRKSNWPFAPDRHYNEWTNWYDFLESKIEYIYFNKLKKEVKKLRIKSKKEYQQKRKPTWPSTPNKYYKDEWTNWYDFLGK